MSEDQGEQVFPRRRVSLDDLRAQWLATGSDRFQMGISVLCPGHRGLDHRLEFWFLNPCDGGPPKPVHSLYFRTGSSLDELTLTSGLVLYSGQQPLAEHIWVEGHWAGYVYSGWVLDAMRIG